MATSALATVQDIVYGTRETFLAVQADRDMKFDAEAGFAMQILGGSDYALGLALRNKQSVINAVTNVAAIGLTLNPALRQAYLVPRDGKICLDIGYLGLIELAIKSGAILWAQSRIVCIGDEFMVGGMDREPIHKFSPFNTGRNESKNWMGAFVTCKTPDGGFLTHVMGSEEILGIRERSQAWKAWVKDKKKCPWVTDPGEMWKKTVVKQAAKWWPKSERVAAAIHYLNNEAGEGLAPEKEELPQDDLQRILAGLEKESTTQGVMAYFKAHQAELPQGSDSYQSFRRATNERLAAIRGQS